MHENYLKRLKSADEPMIVTTNFTSRRNLQINQPNNNHKAISIIQPIVLPKNIIKADNSAILTSHLSNM